MLHEFYEPEEIRRWLHSRHPQLDDRRAIDLVREGKAEMVVTVVDRLRAEVYV